MLLLWGHLLTSDSLQFGYKSGTSTTQCRWLVSEVADFYQKRGTPIICVTLDCSKAFDKCRFDKLFEKLLARKVPAVVIRVLIYIYEEQTAHVKLLDLNPLVSPMEPDKDLFCHLHYFLSILMNFCKS